MRGTRRPEHERPSNGFAMFYVHDEDCPGDGGWGGRCCDVELVNLRDPETALPLRDPELAAL